MSKAAEIIKAEKNQIVEFNEFEKNLAEFKSRYENVVYDLTDPKQDKQARSDRLSIGKVISSLDKTHKELKAPLKEKVDLIDGERKRIKDELLDIQENIKSQIAAHEKAIADHAAMLQKKVDDIEEIGIFGEFANYSSSSLIERLNHVKTIIVDDSYEHRKADATLAQIDVIKKLEPMIEDALKKEAEAAELERLRQEKEDRERKEREERIAQEARQAAEIEAAEAKRRYEQEIKEASERAEIEKKAAIERERKAAEDREASRIAAEIEEKRIQKAEIERREADKNHRAKINNQALASLLEGGIDPDIAKIVIELIAKKQVANVVINY